MADPRDARTAPVGSWFCWTPPRESPRLRLLCLPPAGAGAAFFRAWTPWVPPGVELFAYRPRGRDSRISEPASRQFSEYLSDALVALPELMKTPVAFFGHSLGGLVAFELARAALEIGNAPRFVVASAVSSPQHVVPSGLETAGDDELVSVLRSFGGTPREVIDDAELLALVVATLRADYCCLASYATLRRAGPLDVPLYIVGGRGDPIVPREHLHAWREQTSSQFTCKLFEGGHFFVNEDGNGFATWLAGVIAAG